MQTVLELSALDGGCNDLSYTSTECLGSLQSFLAC